MRQSRRWWTLWLFVLVLLAWRTLAQAHLLNTGFGPFYDGLTHLFVTPEDLLPVVALTLLAGLRGAQCGRWVLFVLPGSWLAGMTVGLLLVPHGSAAWLTCGLTIVLGALVAADWQVPLPVVIGHSVRQVCQRAATHVPSLLDALDDWSILDSYDIPTRSPNGLPADIPARVYNYAAARSALTLAEAVYTRMDPWFADTQASDQGDS